MAKTSYREQIYEDYRGRIQRGEIDQSTRLVDKNIADQLGVSRMPVREALMQLAHEGYLEGTSRGFALPNLSDRQVLEVFELRRLLEPYAAGMAAQTITDQSISRLRDAVTDTMRALEADDVSLLFKAIELFRNTWLGSVPNTELKNTIHRYHAQVRTVRVATMQDPEIRNVLVKGQFDLYEAFTRRDSMLAMNQMQVFVQHGKESYLRCMSQVPDSTDCG
ncbi:GntR family transcriptional regulator [Aliiroseovarius sp. 2305UL8-7]|uniref:GntR family transcriptional regulator n=1 Tax=Aliiroseovarius conchicola TaxID=3121637 RepID=UPI00352725A3